MNLLGVFFFVLSASLLTSGCQSPANIPEVMLSLQTVRKTLIAVLPQGLREESVNGRELTSGYFNPQNLEEDATDKVERAYAKVVILNASRPYRIDAHVYREKRVSGTYRKMSEDKKLTKDLVSRIKEALADRREDRNVIDDFRAF